MHNTLEILGVLKDFHFESLHAEIKPFGFTTTFFANRYAYLIANVNTSDYGHLLADMDHIWKKTNPTAPFVYSFLDKDFQRNYEKDQQTSQLVVDFTVIAILIACLGLLGLAAFSAEQRFKEIGIRKVLGASAFSVTAMLSKDFIRLVGVAILIASPLAWWLMNQWLQNFAYKIAISWWMFLAAGSLAVLIALATVSIQSVKAALANPIKSLRSE
jgi:putative ABC transport system permease protein